MMVIAYVGLIYRHSAGTLGRDELVVEEIIKQAKLETSDGRYNHACVIEIHGEVDSRRTYNFIMCIDLVEIFVLRFLEGVFFLNSIGIGIRIIVLLDF